MTSTLQLVCVCVQKLIIYPAEALNTDVVSIWPTWRAVGDAVLQLIVRRSPGNPAEELAAILH